MLHVNRWQSFLSSLVGFTGVIIALIFNQRHNIRVMKAKRDSESAGIRTVFIAEISDITRSANHWTNRIIPEAESKGWENVTVPGRFDSLVFASYLDSLKVLSGEEISQIVLFYNHVRFMTRELLTQETVGRASRKGYAALPENDDFSVLMPGGAGILRKRFGDMSVQGKKTIELLSLHIPK